jgi:simple sugar transport system ATP-binding protein
MTITSTAVPILEARGLTRSFGAVQALVDADFEVYRGEVAALIGDNGAGKSTMVKALSGNLALDSGSILFNGREVDLNSPSTASHMGIETVFQDLALAPHLTPPQNMFLGRELPAKGIRGKFGFMDTKTMRTKSKEAFEDLGATVRSYTDPVGSMSGGQRQAIAIARAVAWAKGVVLLDEPTAALGVAQTRQVLDLVRRLAEQGLGVVLISHNMADVFEVSDRIACLYLGRMVAQLPTKEVSHGQIVELITAGRSGDLGLQRPESVTI